MRNDVRVQGEEDLSPGTECLCWRGVWDSESVWYIHTGAGGGALLGSLLTWEPPRWPVSSWEHGVVHRLHEAC